MQESVHIKIGQRVQVKRTFLFGSIVKVNAEVGKRPTIDIKMDQNGRIETWDFQDLEIF